MQKSEIDQEDKNKILWKFDIQIYCPVWTNEPDWTSVVVADR